MKTFIKVLIGLVLVSGIVAGSFAAGMIFYAHYYTPARADSSVTALSLPGATGFDSQTDSAPVTVPSEFSTFWEAWSFLNEQYYGELPDDVDRVYGATRGMVASFGDQHTTFIDPIRASIMSENISGSFEGIGATIRLDESSGRLMIADTSPGRPAFDAGLRPGDLILKIDGQPTDNLNLFEAVLLIRGPAGSEVVLTAFRQGEREPFDITVIRAKIEIEVVQSEMLESGDIGYVQLTQFSKGASEKIAEAVTELFDQGATSLVFDLRSNPGGLLSEAVAVSSLFIKDGTIVIEKLKGGEEKVFTAKPGEQVAAEVPLVLLVNGGSASASEIVAGAIQDHNRGTIIGEQTFGKGTVQLPHKLSDGSELRVTVAEWLTPANRQIRNEGIAPDIVVEMTVEDLEQELDPQLEEAIRVLSQNE